MKVASLHHGHSPRPYAVVEKVRVQVLFEAALKGNVRRLEGDLRPEESAAEVNPKRRTTGPEKAKTTQEKERNKCDDAQVNTRTWDFVTKTARALVLASTVVVTTAPAQPFERPPAQASARRSAAQAQPSRPGPPGEGPASPPSHSLATVPPAPAPRPQDIHKLM